jgi:hypothetical protein
MWNSQVGVLLGGTTICLYDGKPGRPRRPAARLGARCGALPAPRAASFFGAGAAFYANCLKAGVEPMRGRPVAAARRGLHRLTAVRRVLRLDLGSTCPRWRGQRHLDRPSAAAPTSRAPSSAACARCRWCAARCSAAAWAPRSRPFPTRRRRRGPAADRRGGRTGVHRADAVDAAAVCGATPTGGAYHDSYFDMYPERRRRGLARRVAPRRLDPHRAAWHAPAAR